MPTRAHMTSLAIALLALVLLTFVLYTAGCTADTTVTVRGTPVTNEVFIAATVTAHVAAGIVKYDALALIGGDPTTNLIQVGTAATGYTASAEGSTTTARLIDYQQIAPTNQFFISTPPRS